MSCCSMSSVTTKRPQTTRRYNSSRRAAQAAQTRADVLAAAVEGFRESGWAGTTLNAVAERAGVAVETIYHAFGTKKQLLREAFGVAVVGDAEPIPLVERPEWAEMQRGSRAERIAKGVALNTDIQERSAHVWRAIVEAAHSDPEVAAVQDEIEAGRVHDSKLGLELVLRKPVDGPVYDVLFALYGPETYVLLTERRGLSRWSTRR